MQQSVRKNVLVAVCCLFVSACSLPRGAALQSEVLDASDDIAAPFAVQPVTRSALPLLSNWPATGERSQSWIARSQGGGRGTIQVGDQLDLLVWDNSENSLLTGLGQKAVPLQKLVVDNEGMIFVPYLDRVSVRGQSTESARQSIQNQLTVLVPSAQVQLSMTPGQNNSVDLVGGVGQPGTFPLPSQTMTVLSLIAQGGGVSASLKNPQIRLMRSGSVYSTSIARLYAEPSLDTALRGGDKVIVKEDDRFFMSLGAAGSEAVHPFTKDVLSAIEAISIIGGLSDSRADPKGILILREYPRAALTSVSGREGPEKTQVVFTLDLTSADGLFSARNFRINSGDLVLATESPVTKAQTIMGLIGSGFGLAGQVSNNSN